MRKATHREFTCAICEGVFVNKCYNQKYCEDCKKVAKVRENRKWCSENRGVVYVDRTCEVCNTIFSIGNKKLDRTCSAECSKERKRVLAMAKSKKR